MNLSDLLPPERVREIAELWMEEWYDKGPVNCTENAINAAAPEIARAVLELAAKRCRASIGTDREGWPIYMNGSQCAAMIEEMAKEITP